MNDIDNENHWGFCLNSTARWSLQDFYAIETTCFTLIRKSFRLSGEYVLSISYMFESPKGKLFYMYHD